MIATPASLETARMEKTMDENPVIVLALFERGVERVCAAFGPNAENNRFAREPSPFETAACRLDDAGQCVVFVIKWYADDGLDPVKVGYRRESAFDIVFDLF